MSGQDRDYYLRRETAELRLAALSTDDSIRAVHQKLAKGYREKIEQMEPSALVTRVERLRA